MKQKRYTSEGTKSFVNFQKSILLVIALGLFSMASFASNYRNQHSQLTVSMWERSMEFIVVLDGYQQRGQGVITLENIKPGKHYIEVIQLHRSRCSNERGKTRLYRGALKIPRQAKMIAVVNPQTGFRVVKVQRLLAQSNTGYDDNYYQNETNNSNYYNEYTCGNNPYCNSCGMENNPFNSCDYGGGNCGMDNSACSSYNGISNSNSNPEFVAHDLYTQYMIDHNMYNDNSSTMPTGYYGSYMTNYELEHLVKEMDHAWFDSDRIKMAKRRIKAKKVTSAQVLEIIQQLNFESSRLEVAKYAYDYTIDQENYYEVNSGFDFSTSINELEESIYR